MINELIEALAQGPLVATEDGDECAYCHNRTDDNIALETNEQAQKNLVHDVNCPVNQARLLIAYMEKNMTEVIG